MKKIFPLLLLISISLFLFSATPFPDTAQKGFKEKFKKFLDSAPKDVKYMAKKFEEMFSVHGVFFEEMGLEYIGPIDGHNLEEIIETLKMAKELKKPVIVHAKTIKGNGRFPARRHY